MFHLKIFSSDLLLKRISFWKGTKLLCLPMTMIDPTLYILLIMYIWLFKSTLNAYTPGWHHQSLVNFKNLLVSFQYVFSRNTCIPHHQITCEYVLENICAANFTFYLTETRKYIYSSMDVLAEKAFRWYGHVCKVEEDLEHHGRGVWPTWWSLKYPQ